MRATQISAVCVLLLASASAQSRKPEPSAGPPANILEAKVRKTWEDYKNRNKDGFAAVLADGFREVEEDSDGFADKKTILQEMDQVELSQYTLKNFDTRPLGANTALVTYIAEYSGKASGEPLAIKSRLRRGLDQTRQRMESSVRSGNKSEVRLHPACLAGIAMPDIPDDRTVSVMILTHSC